MTLSGELSSCCASLNSSKVTDRKKSAEILSNLLENEELLRILNKDDATFKWRDVNRAIYNYFIKEAEKITQDERKKNKSSGQPKSDLILTMFKAVKRGCDNLGRFLDVHDLLTQIINVFQSAMLKRFYVDKYLVVLCDYILSEPHYHGSITMEEWTQILDEIKTLNLDDNKVLCCLKLLIKYGPLHKLPLSVLRNEFDFVTNLCQNLRESLRKLHKIETLELVLDFCEKNSNDCCLACCKLGEDIFQDLRYLYSPITTDIEVKILLFKFFLLQVRLHHPKGALHSDRMSYAFSWDVWRKQLNTLYFIIQDEMKYQLRCSAKTSFWSINMKTASDLQNTFVALSVAVFRQVFDVNMLNITQMPFQDETENEPATKRQRVDITFEQILTVIKETKSWQWIYLTTEFLKKHLFSIVNDDLHSLLQIISNILLENHDSDVVKHCYECLGVLLVAEKSLDNLSEMGIFNQIYESALRCIGLNQNIEGTHKVLQMMIMKNKVTDINPIFETYFSGVVLVTTESLTTLKIAANFYNIPENIKNTSYRKAIIKWMLLPNGEKNELPNAYMDDIISEVLIKLCFKQWPKSIENNHFAVDYKSFENTYEFNAFKRLVLVCKNDIENTTEKVPYVNEEILGCLLENVEVIAEDLLVIRNSRSYAKDLFKILCLFANLLSLMDKCNLINNLKEILDRMRVKNLFLTLSNLILEYDSSEDIENIKYYHELFIDLNNILSKNFGCLISKAIRECLSTDLLKNFFNILNTAADEKVNIDDLNNLKILSIDILANFCLYEGCNELTEIQEFALDTLTEPNYVVSSTVDYKMLLAFLVHIKKCPVGLINNTLLNNLLNLVGEICSIYFEKYDTVSDIFTILDSLVEHVIASNNRDIKVKFITWLHEFYVIRHYYGYKVSMLLIKCINHLIKVDIHSAWDSVIGENLIMFVPEFLVSNYQEVRLEAIKCLAVIFEMDSFSDDDIFVMQKNLFKAVNNKSLEVFRIEINAMSKERHVDETIARTSSVLHTYGSLIVSSSIWRKKLLYFLIHLSHDKKIDKDSLDRILCLVAVEVNFPNKRVFVTSYVDYLLREWYYDDEKSLTEFPYDILGYTTASEFYKEHANIILPLLFVAQNAHAIQMISGLLQKPDTDLYEAYFSEIMVIVFQLLTHDSDSASIEKGKSVYSTITNALSIVKLQELLTENVDKIVISIVKTIADEKAFERQFAMPYKLLNEKEDCTVAQFNKILSLLQEKINADKSMFEYCAKNNPSKIQCISLNLCINVNEKFTLEDKLKSLHQYVTYIDCLLDSINLTDRIITYIIRDVTYTLLHFISSSSGNTFATAACRYLKKLSIRLLSHNSEVLSDHLPVIVNSLTSLTDKDDELSKECLSLLRYLIVENLEKFKPIVIDLDPFPSVQQLSDVNEVYLKVRSEVVNNNLENEIQHFLKAGRLEWNVGSRADALKHLRTQLSEKKEELKVLHDKSKDIKGYTKDCDNSILHNLIRMLVKLTTSLDNNVSIEAARCLGELGPMDLATLILQPRKPHQFPTAKPFQMLTSHTVNLLSTYIVNENFHLVEASSKALYDVLDSKEGKLHVDKLDDNGSINKNYLYPFLSKRSLKSKVNLVKDKVIENIGNDLIWWPERDHNSWIKELTCKLLECFSDNCFLHALIPICKIEVSFCEEILPHLIHLIVSDEAELNAQAVVKQMNKFFEKLWITTLENEISCGDKRKSIQCILNVIHFLRLNFKKAPQLPFHYLKIARAAYFCSNYFAALLYVEIWSTKSRTVNPGGATILETICESEANHISETVQTILKQSYCALGDLDALYGCNSSHVNLENRVEHFKRLEKWDQVLLHYDIQLANGEDNNRLELVNALKNCGYYHLAMNYENSEGDYECLWRLSRYDGDNSTGNPADPYEKYKYDALKHLRENDAELFGVAIEKARRTVIDTIRSTSLESTRALYGCLTKLTSIQELEDVDCAKRNLSFETLLRKWMEQDKIDNVDFKSIEPIRAQRISVLNALVKNNMENLKKPLFQSYLKLAAAARSDGYFNVAMRTISNMSSISKDYKKYDCLRTFEEAQIYWSMGNKITARYLLKHLLKINEDVRLKFASLKLYGTWMAETHSENSHTILSDYFLEPLKMMKDLELTRKDYENIFQAYEVIASFSDSEYQRILSYIKSVEFERKVKHMEGSKETADKIVSQSRRLDYDQKKAVTIHRKQSLIDQTEIENTHKEKDAYFILAIKYYMLSLQSSDASNIRAFRILSLWLENRTTSGLENLLQECLPKIPTYKFVSILPQVTPHLTNNTSDVFGNHIMKIIERCAKDHPHHTLPIVLALANSNKDGLYNKGTAKTESNDVRVFGAQILLKKLKKVPELKTIIEEMEFTADALIQLAYKNHVDCRPTTTGKDFTIPANLKIQQVKNYSKMLLPTYDLPVRKSCNYGDIIGVHSYHKEFGIVGGINNPKKISCRGTDGIMRIQLLKGKDDLRQDAVMEQVFSNINELLHANKHTRHLLIRTYKVIPLSKRSGILEWVESIRLGDYLIKAHMDYNPSDWKASDCRKAMDDVVKQSTDRKLSTFKQICQNFRPVFHKFFEISYLEPLVWCERRKAYMYSVATTSMCGYILGLGDRHLQNILLDEHTGEVIHIDFGIAFEQGKVLPTPETVPFRLTRDIEDAMGVTGIEGVFRKSCEKTMEVMRKNSETIVTILEVLLYDPLYEWTISPAKAASRQLSNTSNNESNASVEGTSDDDKFNVNIMAERALLRLKQKLHGTEEGGSSSIEGQVEKLLQQARDPSNLCRLFPGWQSFL